MESKLPDWMGVVLSGVIMLGAVGSVWVNMSGEIMKTTTRVETLDQRITDNEAYDSFLQEQHDLLRERVIRTEVDVKHLTANMSEASSSMRELTKEIRILNDRLTEVFIKQRLSEEGKNNG